MKPDHRHRLLYPARKGTMLVPGSQRDYVVAWLPLTATCLGGNPHPRPFCCSSHSPALGSWAEQNSLTLPGLEAGKRQRAKGPLSGSWCLDGEPGVGDWEAQPRRLLAPPTASCHRQSLTFIEHLLVLQALNQTLHTLSDWAPRCKQQKPTLLV